MTGNDPYTEAITSNVFSGRLRRSLAGIALPALCMVGLFAGAALAQQPTPAQQNAIKSACRSDFMAQCSGVQPGGQAALSCLQQHSSSSVVRVPAGAQCLGLEQVGTGGNNHGPSRRNTGSANAFYEPARGNGHCP